MLAKKRIVFSSIFLCLNLILTSDLLSLEIFFKPIGIEKLSRYNEDRVAFQHIQLPDVISNNKDSSIASLLIIKNNQVYLIRDGYDDTKKIAMEAYVRETKRQLAKDLWINRINSKPDYIRITDRRSEKLLNVTEDFVYKNFGNFYISIRDSIITKHVKVFRQLMRDRAESGLHLKREPLSPPFAQAAEEATKYSTTISAKTIGGKIYYAEDSDGDNITETFYVREDDGFNWGYKSGPNILFLSNNKEEDLKQIFGKLCYEAYYGTREEEEHILKTFPKDSEIIEAFKLEKVAQKGGISPK